MQLFDFITILRLPVIIFSTFVVAAKNALNLRRNLAFVRLRLKCDGTRAETRFRLSSETDECI